MTGWSPSQKACPMKSRCPDTTCFLKERVRLVEDNQQSWNSGQVRKLKVISLYSETEKRKDKTGHLVWDSWRRSLPRDKLWSLCIFRSRQFVSCTALWCRVSKWLRCFIGSALGSYFGLLCITHWNSMSSTMAILGAYSRGESLLTTRSSDFIRLSCHSVPIAFNVSETLWVIFFVGNIPATAPVAYTSNIFVS